MLYYPPAMILLIALVAVSGWVIKSVMVTFFGLRRESRTSANPVDLEERLRKIETATSGLIMDVSAMREKDRFMARLQAGAATAELAKTSPDAEGLSPMATQSVPTMRRVVK